MGLTSLDSAVCSLIDQSVARSTLASYGTGKRRYLSFCSQFNLQSLPVSEDTLLRFVAFLCASSLSYPTIRLYLSAVRHLQITHSLPDLALTSFPRLNYALRGLWQEGPRKHVRTRLPITPNLLCKIYQLWSQESKDYDQTMLWAAFCLGFFGLCVRGNSHVPHWWLKLQTCSRQGMCQLIPMCRHHTLQCT